MTVILGFSVAKSVSILQLYNANDSEETGKVVLETVRRLSAVFGYSFSAVSYVLLTFRIKGFLRFLTKWQELELQLEVQYDVLKRRQLAGGCIIFTVIDITSFVLFTLDKSFAAYKIIAAFNPTVFAIHTMFLIVNILLAIQSALDSMVSMIFTPSGSSNYYYTQKFKTIVRSNHLLRQLMDELGQWMGPVLLVSGIYVVSHSCYHLSAIIHVENFMTWINLGRLIRMGSWFSVFGWLAHSASKVNEKVRTILFCCTCKHLTVKVCITVTENHL